MLLVKIGAFHAVVVALVLEQEISLDEDTMSSLLLQRLPLQVSIIEVQSMPPGQNQQFAASPLSNEFHWSTLCWSVTTVNESRLVQIPTLNVLKSPFE
jgi:hypothetical protein